MSLFRAPASNVAARWWDERKSQWLRFAIIIGTLAISAALAFKSPQQLRYAVLALPFAAVGALVLLRWPPLGILIVIAASIFVNVYVPALGLTAALLAGLTGLWIVDMIARRRAISFVSSEANPPLLLFVAVAILAFGVGQFPWYPISPAPIDAQIGGLGIFILSFSAFFLVAHQVRDIRWLKTMTYLFLVLGGIMVLVAVFPQVRRLLQPYYSRNIVGGSLFWTWLTAMAYSQAAFNRKLNKRWRILLGLVLIGLIYARLILGRSWSSGWVPPLITLVVVTLVGAPRLALPMFAVGALGLLTYFDELYSSFILVGDNEYSTLTRLEAWRIVGEIVKVNPILGLGPANYRFYTPLFPILGWHVQFNSHNNYVDIIAQVGLLGLACLFWFYWAIGKLGWQLQSRTPKDGFERAYVYGCIGGLVGTVVAGMLGDWVLPFVYNIGIEGMRASATGWLFLGGLVALEQILHRSEASGDER
ncbi:MAG: O-antigen ligase family protein [Chloroflexi bacterium]|nr:O-antigen ligase family protein [Chloroflexota bacterium]